jgi:hypothetical protein
MKKTRIKKSDTRRILVTHILGYTIHTLQRRRLWIFWETVAERYPTESYTAFFQRCKEIYPGRYIKIIERTIQP